METETSSTVATLATTAYVHPVPYATQRFNVATSASANKVAAVVKQFQTAAALQHATIASQDATIARQRATITKMRRQLASLHARVECLEQQPGREYLEQTSTDVDSGDDDERVQDTATDGAAVAADE